MSNNYILFYEPDVGFELVSALVASPDLKTLRLGLSPEANEDNGPRDTDGHWNILREICEEFKKAGVLPLHLRTLHLGTGIMLYKQL
jgi:hypothetical protein